MVILNRRFDKGAFLDLVDYFIDVFLLIYSISSMAFLVFGVGVVFFYPCTDWENLVRFGYQGYVFAVFMVGFFLSACVVLGYMICEIALDTWFPSIKENEE